MPIFDPSASSGSSAFSTMEVRASAVAVLALLAACAVAPPARVAVAPRSTARPAIAAVPENGPLAAGAVAAYLDREERDLRARTAGSGVGIVRRGDAIRLELPAALTFDFNSSTLRPVIRAALDQIALTAAGYRATSVDIGGHTDAVGTDAVNQRLSEARAASVAAYLQAKGVDSRRIAVHGYGKARPIAPNDSDEARARNRRVEIDLLPFIGGDRRGQ